MDDKIKEVMGLVDEYLDSKIKNGSYTYNEKTHCARLAIEAKLRELVQSKNINGYESGMQSGSKVTLWFESPDAAEAWFDNFTENFQG